MKILLILVFLLPSPVYAISNYWILEKSDSSSSLQLDELTLEIDGKKKEIQQFFVFSEGDHTQKKIPHPAARRNLVILFDLESLSPEQLVVARKTAAAILNKVNPNELTAIATVSRIGLQYLCMFTTSRTQGISALNEIGQSKSLRPTGPVFSDIDSSLTSDAEFLNQIQRLKENNSKNKADPRGGIVEGLAVLAFQLSLIHGPKPVLFFSAGFDTKGIQDRKRADDEAPELVMGEVSEEERLQWQRNRTDKKEGPSFDYSKIPELMAGSGTRVMIAGSTENEFYSSLVSKTGGILQKEISIETEELPGPGKDYWVIGWSDTPEKEFKRVHELRIRKGTQTLTESPWTAPRSLQSLTAEERRIKASEAMFKDYGSSEPFAFLADSIFQDGVQKIPAFVEIPGDYILKTTSSEVSMEIYGFSVLDGVLDSFFLPVNLDLKNKKLKEKISTSGLKAWNVLSGRPGYARVMWVIFDFSSDRIVTHVEGIEIDAKTLTLSRPFFPDLNLNWVLWPAPNSVSERNNKQIRYPYTAGSDYFFPDLVPQLQSEEGRILYMRLYNKQPESKNPPIAIKIKDDAGKSTVVEQFQLLQKPNSLENNGVELFWKIASFPASEEGKYWLEVEIRDTSSGKAIARVIPVRFR